MSELREAARRAGIQRDDPMMPLLTAFALMIRYTGTRTAASDRTLADATLHITGALESARQTANAETARFRANIQAAQAETVRDMGTAVARSADQAFTRRIRVFDRNTAFVAAGVVVAVAASCLGGGYWWGNSRAYAAIHETEAGLQAAFSRNAENAKTWLDLMTWNNIAHAKAQCYGPAEIEHIQKGRRVCDVPLWIEPPIETIAAPLPDYMPTITPELPMPQPQRPPPQAESEPLNPFGLPRPPHGMLHFGPESSQ